MDDKNMQNILRTWGFKPVDANGRVIGSVKAKTIRIANLKGDGIPVHSTTDSPEAAALHQATGEGTEINVETEHQTEPSRLHIEPETPPFAEQPDITYLIYRARQRGKQ